MDKKKKETCQCEDCTCDGSCDCTDNNPCSCESEELIDNSQAPEEPEMWEHFCPREGYDMYIGKGEPCNWCGLLENGESV